MIVRHWIPLSLLAVLPQVFAAQVPFQQQNVSTLSRNLIDVLNSDEDYTSLLRLLQKARLIPTLNRLNGSTFFAPTNEAIKRHSSSNSLWSAALSDDPLLSRDNIQEQLRQELFYHLLNYTIPDFKDNQSLKVHKTLHFPRTPVEPPSKDPPPYPPWFPIPGGTLGGQPQRLRVLSRESTPYVGVDGFGNGGAQVIKPVEQASNGVLFGIDQVLTVPPDLATVISQHSALQYLTKILSPDVIAFLNSTAELTLFLPVDSAWEALPYYERLYLESSFGTDDLTRIVNMHAVAMKDVKYSDSFKRGVNLTTIDGPKLEVSVSENKTTVSAAKLIEPDIYAANGVIHTVDSLLVPPGSLQLTPEKYLLVLNCTTFVSLIHSVNLTHLINDTEAKWTILAPQDDVIEIAGGSDLPERGSEELKRLLQYHFIPGRQPPKKLKDGMLLETALEEPGLANKSQVLGVEVSPQLKGDDEPAIRFGGAGVIGEKVEIDNTLIYFVSHTLTPPADVLQTALPSLHLSTFLAAVFSTGLADSLKVHPRTTLLIPHNVAFERLGMLVSSHLLAASSKPDLQRVILHHVLDGVEYAPNLHNGSQRTFSTLEGSDVQLERVRPDNGTLRLSSSGGWADMHSLLFTNNTLTETGVIHEVSDIMIPRSVDITVGKLVRAAKATTMATMVVKAGLDWVLNGTAPPEGSPWADMGLSGSGWTLLCPNDDAFKAINITKLYEDPEALRSIVAQHLIPVQPPAKGLPSDFDIFDNVIHNRPLVLDDDTTYTTLWSSFESAVFGDIVFRKVEGSDDTVVGIKGARGNDGKEDWARVISWGRSTSGGGTGGVIQIDSLLVPYSPTAWSQYGLPVGVGAVGVALIGLFFYGVRIVWIRDTTEATYEPVGGFGQEDDDC